MSIAIDSHRRRTRAKPVVAVALTSQDDSDFIATLAHEIRNILSPLGSSLDLLNVTGIDERSSSQAREVIGRQLRQLQRLVNDLLDAHQSGHEQIQLVPQWTELSGALNAIGNDHRPVFASHGIGLSIDVPTGPVWLNLDMDRIDQAVGNLLSNSLKFTDRGGSVRVALALDLTGRRAVITVADTGIGIEPAVMHAIFDPHAHDSSSRNASGLGLGLPLVRRLVEMHGGQLTAHSEGLGKGSEFCIVLPLPAELL